MQEKGQIDMDIAVTMRTMNNDLLKLFETVQQSDLLLIGMYAFYLA